MTWRTTGCFKKSIRLKSLIADILLDMSLVELKQKISAWIQLVPMCFCMFRWSILTGFLWDNDLMKSLRKRLRLRLWNKFVKSSAICIQKASLMAMFLWTMFFWTTVEVWLLAILIWINVSVMTEINLLI